LGTEGPALTRAPTPNPAVTVVPPLATLVSTDPPSPAPPPTPTVILPGVPPSSDWRVAHTIPHREHPRMWVPHTSRFCLCGSQGAIPPAPSSAAAILQARRR